LIVSVIAGAMTSGRPFVPGQSARGPSCPACDGPSDQVSDEFEGYIEGYRLSVMECRACTLRFSSRFDVPYDLYENIYVHGAMLPGYDRYAAYASAVTEHPRPLDLLASSELPYWLVRDHVRSRLSPGAKVVDLGCGEGYLTYALRREGIQCVGVDVSATVVERARRRFGQDDWFHTVDELADKGTQEADLVIAAELLEHVAHPVDLVNDAVAMLKQGGTVLMTTPNRDASPQGSVWDTDLPPVHLLWFGRTALVELAGRAECEATFIPVPDGVVAGFSSAVQRRGTWPPLLTASGQPSTAVARARSLPWRARRRLAGWLNSVSDLIERSPYRHIPELRLSGYPPATIGVCFSARVLGAANEARR
jgi:SAM-dependent methyltransferase